MRRTAAVLAFFSAEPCNALLAGTSRATIMRPTFASHRFSYRTLAMAAAESATAASIRAEMLAAGRAPVAKTVPFTQTVEVAGVKHTLDDEYQWLRGKAWPKLVEDEDIIAHLEEENAYCKDFLASLGDLQETFFQTMKGRMKLTDRSVEVRQGGYYYYSRTEEQLQYSIDCRVPVAVFDELKASGSPFLRFSETALRKVEEVILDRNK